MRVTFRRPVIHLVARSPGSEAKTRNELGDAIKVTARRNVLPPPDVLRPTRELSSSGLVTTRPVRQESRPDVAFLLRRHPHLPLLVNSTTSDRNS
jgi:hypothetical protein